MDGIIKFLTTMKKLFVLFILLSLAGTFIAAIRKPAQQNDKAQYIPESKQRVGDAGAGFTYLTTGDYVKSGIPYDFFLLATGKPKKNYLARSGLNANISHEFTVVQSANGENLVAPNCLQCHAQVFNDSLVIGMGNSFSDFTPGRSLNRDAYTKLEEILRKNSPAKYEASKAFIQVAKTIGPYLTTQVKGVNAADRLAAVLAAHRDPLSFKWSGQPLLDIPAEVIPSDVPAWWLLKKKHAMFYNGFGRGDFGRFLMASNLLTVNDTAESRTVDNRIPDVLAYIYTLEAPKYPKPIDAKLAKKGEIIFIRNCSKCHGKYGAIEEYPNLLIPASIIKTDSALYKSNYQNEQFVEWFNKSWFAQGDHPAKLVPYSGYIAPPLDGVWSTAPYLHNGSVPNIEAVLNSKLRPSHWQRDFDKPQYDYEKLGWQYKIPSAQTGNTVYNTTLPGYGNYGHYFGDKLSNKERAALLEYLKTL
jgi:mono/diheme cytochrome c family protein